MTNPTVLLIHGAWHEPSCFDLLKDALASRLFPVVTVRNAVAVHPTQKATCRDDVKAIHAVILPLMDEGKEIFVVKHSYGGVPGCASTEGQSVHERAKRGEKGGIIGITLMTAFCIPTRGIPMHELLVQERVMVSGLKHVEGDGWYVEPKAKAFFYNDVSDEIAQKYIDRCKFHPESAASEPVHFVVTDLQVPSFYLLCEYDEVLPPAFQEMMSKKNPKMKTIRCSSGHSPFVIMPQNSAFLISECIRDSGEKQ